MTPGGAVLGAAGVRVRRGRRVLLDDVTFAVRGGELVALRGGNGSGKTSLLRVLAGATAAAAGTVSRPAACAFVPDRVRLAGGPRCGEWLARLRALRGLAPIDWAGPLEASGLAAAVLDQRCGELSKGMTQRVALLEALTSGAPALVLDEPFSGLDHDGRVWLGGALAAQAGAGAAVLLSDHADQGAASWCRLTRALAIGDGTVVADGDAPPEAPAVTIRAVAADGAPLTRVVAGAEVDATLRALLDAGAHILEVTR